MGDACGIVGLPEGEGEGEDRGSNVHITLGAGAATEMQSDEHTGSSTLACFERYSARMRERYQAVVAPERTQGVDRIRGLRQSI